MIRIGCGVEIILMADRTVRWNGIEHTTGMTGGTVDGRVTAGQREAAVVEYRAFPGIDGMTLLAVAREAGIDMIRIGGGVEVVRMTIVAVRGQSRELIADVAGITIYRCVTTG